MLTAADCLPHIAGRADVVVRVHALLAFWGLVNAEADGRVRLGKALERVKAADRKSVKRCRWAGGGAVACRLCCRVRARVRACGAGRGCEFWKRASRRVRSRGGCFATTGTRLRGVRPREAGSLTGGAGRSVTQQPLERVYYSPREPARHPPGLLLSPTAYAHGLVPPTMCLHDFKRMAATDAVSLPLQPRPRSEEEEAGVAARALRE